jgi:2'-5' RNA ligase
MTALMAWLVPAGGPARDHVAATIGALAAEHGGPRFEPHVTIAGRFHCSEQAAARALTSLAAGVGPFEVRFATVGSEPAYFRALYLRAEPSRLLTALHDAARAAWALDARPYMPHLSLLYTNIAEERKPAIIDALGIPLPLTIRINAAELWADHPAGVPGWHRVARIPLSGPREGQITPGGLYVSANWSRCLGACQLRLARPPCAKATAARQR